MEGSHGRGQTPHKVSCILKRRFITFSHFYRVEILESQLTTYGKAMTEDKLREETKRLMSDKESYQTAAKENLKRLVDEKLEASKRLKEVIIAGCIFLLILIALKVETSLSNLEEEYSSLHQLYDKVVFSHTCLLMNNKHHLY